MKRRTFLTVAGAGAATLAAPSLLRAQSTVRIGLITTLSGPGGYIGADIRDGFNLAIEMEGGKLGGVPVQVVVEDDGFRPGQGKTVAERMLRNDGIKLLTGIVFSNILGATLPDVLDSDAIYVSPNAAPSNFAGKECHKNYYAIAWQNDSLHRSAGQTAKELGYKRAFILAPNYQAGQDALAGFKRMFGGTIVGEQYTRLDQTDYAAEMAAIRAANPDVVFQFHPGGLGIAFLRQYAQAGLIGRVPMVVAAPSLDHTTLKAVGDVADGLWVSSHWNVDFDNAANKKFVPGFQQKFNRIPTYYASQSRHRARHRGRVEADQGRHQAGGVPHGDAEGGFRLGAGCLQVRRQPASGPGLVRAEGRQERVGRDANRHAAQGADRARRQLLGAVQTLSA